MFAKIKLIMHIYYPVQISVISIYKSMKALKYLFPNDSLL
jgi:hypothetical protein